MSKGSRVRRSLAFVAASVAMVAGGPAVAQAAPAPAAASGVDPARLAAARTLVGTLRIEQQMRGQQAQASVDGAAVLDRMIPAQLAMRAQLTDSQGYARAKTEAVRLITEDRQRTIEETVPLMVEAEVRRYANHFSLEELRGLEAFYRSPLGQRVIGEQPNLSADNLQFQQNVLTPVITAHNAVLIPKLAATMGPVLRQAGANAAPPAPSAPPGKKP